jgi:glycosyltransferase involved in cell wall biosynthesis
MRPVLAPPARPAPLQPEQPTFSVVIAAYQAAGTIGAAVESALSQTRPPLEVIVSDDGSTDDLEGALAAYRDHIVVLHGPNRGPGAARNAAFRTAQGDFVAILDADDLFLPERLEAFAEVTVARPDLDIVTTDAFMELDGEVVRHVYDEGWTFEVGDQRIEILNRNFIFGLAAVRRGALLAVGGMDEAPELIGVEDWDLWIRMILAGSSAGLIPEPLARNRLSQGSLSSQRERRVETRISTLSKALGNPDLRPQELRTVNRALVRQRAELGFLQARKAVAEGRPAARRRALRVAFASPLGAERLRPRSRLRAVAWALAPRAAAARLRRAEAGAWEGAGSILHGREGSIRVAFYCDSPEVGGAERSLGTLLERLGERFEVTVVGTRAPVVEWLSAQRPATRTVLLPHVHGLSSVRAIGAHFSGLHSVRPQVVHANLSNPWESHWAIFAALATRAPTISVVHLPLPARRMRQRLIKRLTRSRIAAHVTVGARSARELERLTGLPLGSVRVIPNGVPDVPLEPLPRPAEGVIVGSIGRLEPQKGYDVLVRALSSVPEVTVVLVGDGSERERLGRLAGELGVDERVLFPGWSEEARRQLSTFDLFVLPSRFEALPLVLIEAMLAELPVVASDVGSVPEVVEDGVTGLLVAADDPVALAEALSSLVADPQRRRDLGKRGRARALEHFDADAMVRAYERLYDELAG